MNALVRLTIAAVVVLSSAAGAEGPPAVSLPSPRTSGKVPVEVALQQRRSLRNPAPGPLALEDVGQLCWAAQGVTDAKGHRTAPSARGTYPLDLYVVAGAVTGLAPGLYRYVPARHALEEVRAGDLRVDLDRKAVGQAWIARAPAIFVVAGRAARVADLRDRGPQFMAVEAGLAAQGFFLQAEALGLGSTFIGGFRPPDARAALGLGEGEEVLALLPVGRRP